MPSAAPLPPDLRNIVFDLGGVLLDLHIERTAEALAALGGKRFADIWNVRQQAPFFQAYECGRLSDTEFCAALRQALAVPGAPDAALQKAWNAMLGPLPPARLDHLRALRRTHRIFLLSNTNALHLRHLTAHTVSPAALAATFERRYLSFEMGARKPDAAAFAHVLRDSQLQPEHTLFVDDVEDNVQGARRLGMHGRLHPAGADLRLSVPLP